MFSLSEPQTETVRQFLSTQVNLPFSYAEVGWSKTIRSRADAPRGYNFDHYREQLGQGDELYRRARRALSEWRMFRVPWLVFCWPYLRIVPGEVCAVLALHLNFWSMNAARIVYVIDEPQRFGFGYGTLPGHTHRGEERFVVEQLADGTVWYEVLAFSRPRHWLVKAGAPVARLIQKRFGPASAEAMVEALLESGESQRRTITSRR
jgi:uncharacterized protein (UPF0548 family)